jgi:hypothetical protein
MAVSMAHTSVPRWADTLVPANHTPVHYIVVISDADPTPAGLPGHASRVSPAELDGVLEQACVGWHFVIVDRHSQAGAIRARLLSAGAIDSEISIVLTGTGAEQERRVYCPHCRQVTSSPVTVGATVACAGCAAPLVVHHHFSRRLGAHLGYRVDSEDLP